MAGRGAGPGDDLFEVEPAGFIAARDALVKELKAEGRKDDAAAVAKLRRPTPGAWALNQVARTHPEVVAAALTAGGRLRDASDAAVGGDASALRQATAEERAAVDALVGVAAKHLGAKGAAARPQLAATVRAAALDGDVADELARGVLTGDHEATGFGFGSDAPPPSAPAKPTKSTEPTQPTKPAPKKAKGEAKPDRAAVEERKAAERAAKEEAAAREEAERQERRRRAELEAEAQRLAKRASRLDATATRLEEEATQARAAADEAAAAAEEAAAAVEAG